MMKSASYTSRMKPVFALLLLLSALPARADFYIWKDERGVEHFSDTPPDESKAKKQAKAVKSDPRPNAEGNPGAQAPAPAASPAKPGAKPAHKVELYTTSWCPVCRAARLWLNANGVPFTDYDVERDRAANARYGALGGRGVPLAVIDGRPVYGFEARAYERLLK